MASCSCGCGKAGHSHEKSHCLDVHHMAGAYALQVEYKSNPLGMDEEVPRFSYRLEFVDVQSARQLQVLSPDGGVFWDTGWVKDGSSQLIPYEGPAFQPHTRYHWRVRVKDDSGKTTAWNKEEAWFETGFMSTAWTGKWIRTRLMNLFAQICPVFFKEFTLEKGHGKVKSARFYGSAFGLYEALVNGEPITDATLLPGWTDYFNRVQYQCFDITKLIKSGSNYLDITLASGWHQGKIANQWNRGEKLHPQPPMIRAEIRITFSDGTVQVIGSDSSFRCSSYGPVRFSDIYDGEVYEGWRMLERIHTHQVPVENTSETETETDVKMVWNSGPLTRTLQYLRPESITKRGSVYIVDFGQNLTGREVLHIKGAPRGATITVHHGEMLNEDGSVYTENLRTARALTVYSCNGNPDGERYEPHFTFFGFRYLEVSGWPGRMTTSSIEAAVLSSDLPRTGMFNCSNEMLNKLYENTGWGMRSNFVDVPTDCPQRDERYGWTGDTQVFCNTATYNVAAGDFYTKWLGDMNAFAAKNRYYPDVIPPALDIWAKKGSTGWGDAGLIVPWNLYVKYGDTRILEQGFQGMRAHLDTQLEKAGKSLIGQNCAYGDWLNINVDTSKEYIATAYMAGMARLLSRIASVLGKDSEEKKALSQYEAIRKAFQKAYIDKNGVKERTQCAYLLALHFDLLPEKLVKPTVQALVNDIRVTQKMHLSTGFLGTPLLLPVLTRFGEVDLAYELLQQTTYPGWLYPITQGATTMWERWNSYTKEKGFGDVAMNSFNHYAYGAVCEWFYESIAGIQPIADDPHAVGFKRFRLAPYPGHALDFADAFFLSPYGGIVSAWERNPKEGLLAWHFAVPDNTTAEVTLPREEVLSFTGEHSLVRDDAGRMIALPGEYVIVMKD